MKINKCKCGILKNVDSDECCVCKGTTVMSKNELKAINTAKIKANNARTAKV